MLEPSPEGDEGLAASSLALEVQTVLVYLAAVFDPLSLSTFSASKRC